MPPSATERLHTIWIGGVLARHRFRGFKRLSVADRNFWLVWLTRAEIDNGGFDQFTTNSTGEHAALVPNAFQAIGLPAAAAILREYIELLVGEGRIAPTITGRMRQLSRAYRRHGDRALARQFDRLAKRFHRLEPRMELRLLAYATRHGLPGQRSDSPAVRREATKLLREDRLNNRRFLAFLRREGLSKK